MRAAAVVAVIVAGVVAGCGGGSGEAGARDATTSFIDAIRARDGKRACSYLTENGRSIYSQLGDTPCEQGILAAQFPPGAKVGKATVKGDTASVPLTAPGAPAVIVVLKQQDGSWKVDSAG